MTAHESPFEECSKDHATPPVKRLYTLNCHFPEILTDGVALMLLNSTKSSIVDSDHSLQELEQMGLTRFWVIGDCEEGRTYRLL